MGKMMIVDILRERNVRDRAEYATWWTHQCHFNLPLFPWNYYFMFTCHFYDMQIKVIPTWNIMTATLKRVTEIDSVFLKWAPLSCNLAWKLFRDNLMINLDWFIYGFHSRQLARHYLNSDLSISKEYMSTTDLLGVSDGIIYASLEC